MRLIGYKRHPLDGMARPIETVTDLQAWIRAWGGVDGAFPGPVGEARLRRMLADRSMICTLCGAGTTYDAALGVLATLATIARERGMDIPERIEEMIRGGQQ